MHVFGCNKCAKILEVVTRNFGNRKDIKRRSPVLGISLIQKIVHGERYIYNYERRNEKQCWKDQERHGGTVKVAIPGLQGREREMRTMQLY